MVKETVTLTFQEGNSNKFYTISIEGEKGGNYSVPFTYGRIGTAGQSGFKVTATTFEKAKEAYDQVVKEKTKKGYKE